MKETEKYQGIALSVTLIGQNYCIVVLTECTFVFFFFLLQYKTAVCNKTVMYNVSNDLC